MNSPWDALVSRTMPAPQHRRALENDDDLDAREVVGVLDKNFVRPRHHRRRPQHPEETRRRAADGGLA